MQKPREMESGDRVLNYEDIYLIPNICAVNSRSEVNVGLEWGGFEFSVPVIPSNMVSVLNPDICHFCSNKKIPYFYHRFGDTLEFVKRANIECWKFIGISIGVKPQDKRLLDEIKKLNLKVDAVLIDVANGVMESVTSMVIYSRASGFFTGVGNIWGDKDSVEFLEDVAGVDFLKAGLSCGKNCSTYSTTSFGSPMFSAAIELGKWANVPVIIDGGTRNNGDIVKAIRGFLEYGKGLPLIMLGNLFAACIDAPGENIYDGYGTSIYEDGKLTQETKIIKFKRHFGSASRKNKEISGQSIKHIEGFEVELPCNQMTFEQKIEEIKQSLQSAVSYSGGKDLLAIGEAKWVTVK